jgi:hypothetical protein
VTVTLLVGCIALVALDIYSPLMDTQGPSLCLPV